MAKKVQSNGDISMWSEQHQESVLYSILTDQEFGSKFLTGLGEVGTVYQNSFQNECMKWLLVKVLEYYNEKDLIPSQEYLRFTIENEYANNMYEASELDFLIYNEPMSYVRLLLSGKMEEYLLMNWFQQLEMIR